MTAVLYLPPDEFIPGSQPPDLDLAADYLELTAFLSGDGQAYSQDIVGALDNAAEENFIDVDNEIKHREDIATAAIARMASRQRVLEKAYPFDFDKHGYVVSYLDDEPTLGQIAYLVSLVLSNLKTASPLLYGSPMYPSEQEIRDLRKYFQYFATAALAAEIGGQACSFGFPRPDGTGFIEKLIEIWKVLKDGRVKADPSAPKLPKDDQIDVFAWRTQRDGLPGFLLAAAQVATGANWKDKSIKSHVRDSIFSKRWFDRQPVTEIIAYHIIPFARPDESFRDDVLMCGNVLHRLRVPFKVNEAADMARCGMAIEAFDQLAIATEWVKAYAARARAA